MSNPIGAADVPADLGRRMNDAEREHWQREVNDGRAREDVLAAERDAALLVSRRLRARHVSLFTALEAVLVTPSGVHGRGVRAALSADETAACGAANARGDDVDENRVAGEGEIVVSGGVYAAMMVLVRAVESAVEDTDATKATSRCACAEIMAADPSRHFKECAMRAAFPEPLGLVVPAAPDPWAPVRAAYTACTEVAAAEQEVRKAAYRKTHELTSAQQASPRVAAILVADLPAFGHAHPGPWRSAEHGNGHHTVVDAIGHEFAHVYCHDAVDGDVLLERLRATWLVSPALPHEQWRGWIHSERRGNGSTDHYFACVTRTAEATEVYGWAPYREVWYPMHIVLLIRAALTEWALTVRDTAHGVIRDMRDNVEGANARAAAYLNDSTGTRRPR